MTLSLASGLKESLDTGVKAELRNSLAENEQSRKTDRSNRTLSAEGDTHYTPSRLEDALTNLMKKLTSTGGAKKNYKNKTTTNASAGGKSITPQLTEVHTKEELPIEHFPLKKKMPIQQSALSTEFSLYNRPFRESHKDDFVLSSRDFADVKLPTDDHHPIMKDEAIQANLEGPSYAVAELTKRSHHQNSSKSIELHTSPSAKKSSTASPVLSTFVQTSDKNRDQSHNNKDFTASESKFVSSAKSKGKISKSRDKLIESIKAQLDGRVNKKKTSMCTALTLKESKEDRFHFIKPGKSKNKSPLGEKRENLSVLSKVLSPTSSSSHNITQFASTSAQKSKRKIVIKVPQIAQTPIATKQNSNGGDSRVENIKAKNPKLVSSMVLNKNLSPQGSSSQVIATPISGNQLNPFQTGLMALTQHSVSSDSKTDFHVNQSLSTEAGISALVQQYFEQNKQELLQMMENYVKEELQHKLIGDVPSKFSHDVSKQIADSIKVPFPIQKSKKSAPDKSHKPTVSKLDKFDSKFTNSSSSSSKDSSHKAIGKNMLDKSHLDTILERQPITKKGVVLKQSEDSFTTSDNLSKDLPVKMISKPSEVARLLNSNTQSGSFKRKIKPRTVASNGADGSAVRLENPSQFTPDMTPLREISKLSNQNDADLS
jgi:hypothetical protein